MSARTILANSKSALDRSLTVLSWEHSLKKNKTVTLNEHMSVLAAILSDISDDSDTNFIYILSANECQQRNNKEHFKIDKKRTKSQFVYKQTVGSRD